VPLTSDLETNEVAINYADNKLFVRTPQNTIQAITLGGSGGGGSVLAEYATTAQFPATGVAGTLYCATDAGRLYRWTGSVYAELGSVGGEDTTLRAMFVPPAPTSVTATAGNAQAAVSWTAPSVSSQTPITDYVVQFKAASATEWTTFSDGSSTATSATVTGLTNGTAYVFRVAAVNSLGQGAYSTASSSVTPSALVYLAIPVMTSMTAPSGQVSFHEYAFPGWRASQCGGGGEDVWRVFDQGCGGLEMRAAANVSPFRWLQYAFPENQTSAAGGYRVKTGDAGGTFGPNRIFLSGSNDGETFQTIDERVDLAWADNETKTFTFAAPATYRYWRWQFVINNPNLTDTRVGDIQLLPPQ
jgi:hypothetical protein